MQSYVLELAGQAIVKLLPSPGLVGVISGFPKPQSLQMVVVVEVVLVDVVDVDVVLVEVVDDMGVQVTSRVHWQLGLAVASPSIPTTISSAGVPVHISTHKSPPEL